VAEINRYEHFECKLYPYNGEMLPMRVLVRILGRNESTIRSKYHRGWDGTPERGYDGKWNGKRTDDEPCDPYTDEELYELFLFFAGRVEAEEELRRLSDFMVLDLTKDIERQLCEDMLTKLRQRYIAEGGREHP